MLHAFLTIPQRILPLYHTPMNPNHQTRPQIPPHFWWIQSIYVNAQMKLPIFKIQLQSPYHNYAKFWLDLYSLFFLVNTQ